MYFLRAVAYFLDVRYFLCAFCDLFDKNNLPNDKKHEFTFNQRKVVFNKKNIFKTPKFMLKNFLALL